MKNLLGVCISDQSAQWTLPYPLFTYVEGWREIGEQTDPYARIQYLAGRRNSAVTTGLQRFPESEDILMIDSYYLHQSRSLERLIEDYYEIGANSVLGGVTWGKKRVRLSSWIRPEIDFYDKWAFPDLRFVQYGWDPYEDYISSRFKPPVKGLYHVCSVGGCYIFPRAIWDAGVRYNAISDLHGCEHNWLCEHSGLDCWADFNAPFWREKSYTFVKCLRCSFGYWRRRLIGR